MRPGVDIPQLRGVSYGVRVSVAHGRKTVAVDVPAFDVLFEQTMERAVPTLVKFKVAGVEWIPTQPHDALNNFGQRFLVEAVVEAQGQTTLIPLAWCLITDWVETESGVEVTGVDLVHSLVEAPFTFPSSPPEGATLLSEVQRFAGSLPVVLDAGVANTTVSRSTQFGVDRVQAIQDLTTSRGLLYQVKPDGYLHVFPKRTGRRVDAHYTGRDLLVGAPRKAKPRRSNRVVVTGDLGEHDKPVKVSATREASEYPYQHGLYGTVVTRWELSSITSFQEVEDNASKALREVLSTTRKRQLEIIYDPRLELGDVISVETSQGEIIVGRVHALSAVVDDPAHVMRVDVEELAW